MQFEAFLGFIPDTATFPPDGVDANGVQRWILPIPRGVAYSGHKGGNRKRITSNVQGKAGRRFRGSLGIITLQGTPREQGDQLQAINANPNIVLLGPVNSDRTAVLTTEKRVEVRQVLKTVFSVSDEAINTKVGQRTESRETYRDVCGKLLEEV